MRNIVILISCVLVLLCSCANNDNELEKMIPDNATGVICIDANSILTKGKLLDENGKLRLSDNLKSAIDKNPSSSICKMLNTIVEVRADLDSRLFVFFTQGHFQSGILMNISNCDDAKAWIEKQEGVSFKSKDDIDYIPSGPTLFAIHDNVLFIGNSVGAQDDNKSVKEVAKIFNNPNKSIVDVPKIKDLLDSKEDLVAYIKPEQLNRLINSDANLKSASSKFPIMKFMTEADGVHAIVSKIEFKEDEVKLESEIDANDNSQFIALINAIESKPSADFLKIMPNSMDNVVSISLNGSNILKMPEMNGLLAMAQQIPFAKYLDIRAIVSSINGPVAIGATKDPTFNDEYNYVVALHSENPEMILHQIMKLGKMAGQDPEKMGDEYIYEYLNKRISIGLIGQSIYFKMLDYEQEEQNLYAQSLVKNLFADSRTGIYIHCKNLEDNYCGKFALGFKSAKQIKGSFIPEAKYDNAIIAMLTALCSVKSDYDFSETDSSFMPIDAMNKYE